ncbi:MAG: ribosome rescue protein RqcH [Halococcoides sp.]
MDPKRELTSVDCRALVAELRAIRGASLEKAYLYPERDLLRLKCREYDHGRIELLCELDDPKRVHLADPERVPDAPERPPDFAMMLRNRLKGAELAAVEQFAFDRVLELRFERDDDATTIVAELFGDGNLAVLDSDREVIDCLRTVRLRSRTVAPGEPYESPEAPFEPFEASAAEIREQFRQSDSDVVRTLATQLEFGGLYGEELCSRADVPYNLDVSEVTEEQLDAIVAAIDALGEQLESGDLDPQIYRDDGDPVDATPVELLEYEALEADPVDSFNDALDRYFHERAQVETASASETQADTGPDFAQEIETKQRIIAQQEGAIEDFEAEAAQLREQAEALYAHYDLVAEVLETIREARDRDTAWDEIEATLDEAAERGIEAGEAVESIDPEAGTVDLTVEGDRVTLDPRNGVEKNADRLYREAKSVEGKKEGAKQALEQTRAELEEIRERRARAAEGDGSTGADDEGDADDEPTDWLTIESIPIRSEEDWYERFRWFETSDGFLVIGGRNAEDNEQIVKKYLGPGDRFFHTQAEGGPATVLKATGPSESVPEDLTIPERSRREAAQFAVSYSSVWKDGRYAADVYEVGHDQVSKTPESGEYLDTGGFAIRGERTYHDDTPVGVAVGIACEPETRVIGGPPDAIADRAATAIELEPGRYAQNDIAKRLYREFKDRFADETFVRKIASPDLIQEFCPPGGSRMVDR